ncbi:MAG: MATE family efflux transporter [Spirochaetota bacterium]|nr:MATE family efflux transporter [Spirochaetota bacterium]
MEKIKSDFLNRDRIRKIFKIGGPVFIGMMVQNLINITDNLMVGQMGAVRGDDYPHLIAEASNGLAALGPSLMFIWMVAGFFACINVGTQALVSRREGEERFNVAGSVLANSASLGFIIGIFVAILGSIYLVPEVFPVFHNNREVQRLGIDYCVVRFYSIPAWIAMFTLKAFWDGIAKTHVHMTAAVIMTVTNLFFNYILIYGVDFLGIKPMGTVGAAWGSTICTYIGLLVVLIWTFKKKYYNKYKYFNNFKWKWVIIKEVYRLSLPSGIANIVIMTGFLFFVKVAGYLDDRQMILEIEKEVHYLVPIINDSVVNKIDHKAYSKLSKGEKKELPNQIKVVSNALNDFKVKLPELLNKSKFNAGKLFNEERDKISENLKDIIQLKTPSILKSFLRPINFNKNGAATTIVISIAMVSFIGLLGFGQATATLVGQSLGQQKPFIAQKYGFEAVTILTLLYSIMALGVFTFPEFLSSLFTSDPLVIETATAPVKLWGVILLFVPAFMIFPQALFAAGKAVYVMVIEIILHFSCLIPISYAFAVSLDWGIFGLWLAAGLYVVLLVFFMTIKFSGHSWMSSKLNG